jgi:transcriptional regulator with XRE-family HTH domain
LARNVARLLRKHNLNGPQMKERSGGRVDPSMLRRVFQGKDIYASTLKAMADAMGESLDEFFVDEDRDERFQESLQAFLDSDLGANTTEEEREALKRSVWPPGMRMSTETWYHTLMRFRAARRE